MNVVWFQRKVLGTSESSRLLPIIGTLVRLEGFNDMQEHRCHAVMGALGATNHDYEISKRNSCQSGMR
jgi:hypothetical protein